MQSDKFQLPKGNKGRHRHRYKITLNEIGAPRKRKQSHKTQEPGCLTKKKSLLNQNTEMINIDCSSQSPASKSIHTNQSTPNKEIVLSAGNRKNLVMGESIQQTDGSGKVSKVSVIEETSLHKSKKVSDEDGSAGD